MATIEDLAKLEVFCSNETCGDPVADRQGNIHYTKRRMNLIATEGLVNSRNTYVYQCPICKKRKKFSLDPWTNNIREG